MHVKLSSEELAKATSRMVSVAKKDTETTIPIMEAALVRAEGDKITFAAFDNHVAIVSEHPAEVREPGGFCVNARALDGIAHLVPDGATELASSDTSVAIRSGKARWSMGVLPPDTFPSLPKSLQMQGAKVDAAALADALGRVVFAAATDASRPILGCVNLHRRGDQLRVVATDGHRLALAQAKLKADLDCGTGRLIPIHSVETLLKMLRAQPEAETFLAVSSDGLTLRQPGLAFTTRLLDGAYTEFEQVIPKKQPKALRLNREVFAGALRRIQVLSGERGETARFDLSDGQLLVAATEGLKSKGAAEEPIEVDYRGKPLLFGCNPAYLVQALERLPGDEVRLELGNDDTDPILLRPTDADLPFVITMPKRV